MKNGRVGLDLDRDVRFADIAVAQLVGDAPRPVIGGQAARHNGADERHIDVAARVTA